MKFFLIQIIILVIFVLNNIECRNFRTQKISDSEFFSHSLKTNQGLRTYYVHTPFNQKSLKHPLPVILALHGRLGSGKQIMKGSGFNELADKESFIVVYPDGFERSWADGRGNTPADKNNVDDVGFLKLVLEKVSQDYSVDKRNYFIVGHSNGGFMTQRMLLEESNLFKAGVSVSSQLSLFLLKNYIPKSPVSIALIAGTEDPLVPFYGGYVQDGGEVLSVEDSIDRWKEWNFCPSNGLEESSDKEKDKTSLLTITYYGCKDKTTVKLYKVIGGGHSWPGREREVLFFNLGNPTLELDATLETWKFFKNIEK